jgi:predicted dehydrogenase
MIEAARKNDVKLMVGHVTRLLPLFSRMKEIIDSGQIGEPIAVSMTRYHPVVRQEWWAKRSQKGGLLHSPASHEVDYLNFLCGAAISVYAVVAPQIQEQLDYEDTMFMTVRYRNGTIGSIAASISSTLRVQAGWIIGKRGGLRYDMFASEEGGLVEYQASDGELQREPTGGFGLPTGMQRELRNFADWVLYDAEPLLTAEAGLRAVEVIQAAYQSVQEGKPVMLPLPRS